MQAVWIGALDITEQYGARQRLTLLNEAGTRVGTTLDVTRTARELLCVRRRVYERDFR